MDKTAPVRTVPTHLGLILDGNRRWARQHGCSIAQGHRQGYYNLRTIVSAAFERGVHYISVYAFSTENWQRSQEEVKAIMQLYLLALKHEVKDLHREGIRIRVIGSRLKFSPALQRAMRQAEELTQDNSRGTLLICADYGGQQEIVDAVKHSMATGISAEDMTPELFRTFLYAPDVPPVDLIIRTSGEQRLSNFMLWNAAYSELLFSKKLWPDFSEADLAAALRRYSRIQRRFGK